MQNCQFWERCAFAQNQPNNSFRDNEEKLKGYVGTIDQYSAYQHCRSITKH